MKAYVVEYVRRTFDTIRCIHTDDQRTIIGVADTKNAVSDIAYWFMENTMGLSEDEIDRLSKQLLVQTAVCIHRVSDLEDSEIEHIQFIERTMFQLNEHERESN